LKQFQQQQPPSRATSVSHIPQPNGNNGGNNKNVAGSRREAEKSATADAHILRLREVMLLLRMQVYQYVFPIIAN